MSDNSRLKVDKVRASRDGHEFHVAWAARRALQLVYSSDDLVGIAVEGLGPLDQARASADTVEIADLTLYYGDEARFTSARSTAIVQLKYSIGSQEKPFRASDAQKTIRKFAASYLNYKKNYGAQPVKQKLSFELVTNRPILPELVDAIEGLATGARMKGKVKTQADQVRAASKLGKQAVRQFASKVKIIGLAGSLIRNRQLVARQVADWSPAADSNAQCSLDHLCEVVRTKAGEPTEW